MNAKEARKLTVGMQVKTHFGNVEKSATIKSINWPHFTIVAAATDGRVLERVRNYKSLERVVELPLPSWLHVNTESKPHA